MPRRLGGARCQGRGESNCLPGGQSRIPPKTGCFDARLRLSAAIWAAAGVGWRSYSGAEELVRWARIAIENEDAFVIEGKLRGLPREMGRIEALGLFVLSPAEQRGHSDRLHGFDVIGRLGRGRDVDDLRFFHYRDKDKVEVDCVITRGAKVWGVEVKASATVNPSDGKGLRRLAEQAGKDFRGGALLYDGNATFRLGDDLIHAVPLSKLWTD